MIDPHLQNKVVLITGANHGIGASTAKAFAGQGAKVFITYFRSPTPHSEVALHQARQSGIGGPLLYDAMQRQSPEPFIEEIRAQGGSAVAREADLGNPQNIVNVFNWCETELGPVDILVNNHTHCVLETFDPELTTDDGFGVHLPTTTVIDAHFAINAAPMPS